MSACEVVITGAAGFIGSHLAEALVAAGHRVTGLDNLDNFYDPGIKRSNLVKIEETSRSSPGSWNFVHGDIRDADLVGQTLDSSFGFFVGSDIKLVNFFFYK